MGVLGIYHTEAQPCLWIFLPFHRDRMSQVMGPWTLASNPDVRRYAEVRARDRPIVDDAVFVRALRGAFINYP